MNLPATSVALGVYSTHILTTTSRLFACGSSEFGQFGNGSSLSSHELVEIETP